LANTNKLKKKKIYESLQLMVTFRRSNQNRRGIKFKIRSKWESTETRGTKTRKKGGYFAPRKKAAGDDGGPKFKFGRGQNRARE